MEYLLSSQFVPWFRSVAPYIHAHKGKTFVVGISGELIAAGKLNAFVQDLALIHSLNIRIVLVHGFRSQVEEQLQAKGVKSQYANGIRITDTDALSCAQEAAGRLRYQIEAAFSQGLPNTPMAHAKIRVVSGNFITAKPLGIVNGINYEHTGIVRKLDTDGIYQALDQNAIVLLSPFGYSPTGEAFNLTMEDIATHTALKLKADKLIFVGESFGVPKVVQKSLVPQEHSTDEKCCTAGLIERELSLEQAYQILQSQHSSPDTAPDYLNYLQHCIQAVQGGVQRAHILPYAIDGGILTELFTHNGVGSMIVDEKLNLLREATVDDIGAIIQLIEPLEKQGVLIKRSRTDIERDITAYTVMEHDGVLFGCAAFYPYLKEKTAELAALTISEHTQGHAYGEQLLKHIERRARDLHLKSIFVLTTQTMHWFINKGFQTVSPDWLPEAKRESYNWERRSQVLVKYLG